MAAFSLTDALQRILAHAPVQLARRLQQQQTEHELVPLAKAAAAANQPGWKIMTMVAAQLETPSKGQLDAIFEAERRTLADGQRDVHACRQLWRTVLQRTVDDICFLRRHRHYTQLKKHEEERLRRIRENPPADFVRGAWFEQICD